MSRAHASHLDCCFMRKYQDKALKYIGRQLKNFDFDAFIVTGVSGIVMGSLAARKLKKQLSIVRKPSDNTHSAYHEVENFIDDAKYVFLDDLVSSGSTFRKVSTMVNDRGAFIVGSIIYQYPQFVVGSKKPNAFGHTDSIYFSKI